MINIFINIFGLLENLVKLVGGVEVVVVGLFVVSFLNKNILCLGLFVVILVFGVVVYKYFEVGYGKKGV